MLNFLQARLNQKNRAPPLVHSWDFWHDRQDRAPTTTSSTNPDPATSYEDRLEPLASISDVRQFWNVFNNFDISQLKLRDSIHLFHKGVKPVWEDPRNARGGSWTFRVPKANAAEFWKEICMMAIGEQLQEAVEDPSRKTFRDDICGISLGVRFNSMLVQIWNRDAEHQEGIDRILATVIDGLSLEFKPKEGSYYYKKHNEHAGFGNTVPAAEVRPASSEMSSSTGSSIGRFGMQSLDAVMRS